MSLRRALAAIVLCQIVLGALAANYAGLHRGLDRRRADVSGGVVAVAVATPILRLLYALVPLGKLRAAKGDVKGLEAAVKAAQAKLPDAPMLLLVIVPDTGKGEALAAKAVVPKALQASLSAKDWVGALAAAGIGLKPAYCFTDVVTPETDFFRIGYGEESFPQALSALAGFVDARKAAWASGGAVRSRL